MAHLARKHRTQQAAGSKNRSRHNKTVSRGRSGMVSNWRRTARKLSRLGRIIINKMEARSCDKKFSFPRPKKTSFLPRNWQRSIGLSFTESKASNKVSSCLTRQIAHLQMQNDWRLPTVLGNRGNSARLRKVIVTR